MSFVVAAAVSAAIILVSPFMGQLQSFLRRSLSTPNYVLLFGGGVLLAVGLAIVVAVTRIRDRRVERFALLATALLLGATYMWATATPYAEVNAVERVHFVEYGLIAFLFYRAFRPAGDWSVLILPLLAGVLVGTVDEWLQWFIPVRVGEAHDVFLNLASLACGVLFAVALEPPASFTARLTADSLKRVGLGGAIVWLVFAAFVSQVHLGHAVDIDGVARFHSHYTAGQLDALACDRAERWTRAPPKTLHRLSREDQYLDEGLWHVRRRNVVDIDEAWGENLILEGFFGPVLDTATYASPNGNRWPAEQRAEVAMRVGAVPMPFVSTAEPYPIVTWPQGLYWSVVAAVALLLVAVPLALGRAGS